MSYEYQTERPWIFTEEGVDALLRCRKRVDYCLKVSGAVMMLEAIRGITGSSWHALALVDYLVERREIREVTGSDVAGQHRVFVRIDSA